MGERPAEGLPGVADTARFLLDEKASIFEDNQNELCASSKNHAAHQQSQLTHNKGGNGTISVFLYKGNFGILIHQGNSIYRIP